VRRFLLFLFASVVIDCLGLPVGRPWVYGLAISGQAGVEQVLKHTLAELDITMGLCGYRNPEQLIGKREAIAMKHKL